MLSTGHEFVYDDSKERMPPEERENWLNQRLAQIMEYAYKNAPAIKDKFDKAGVAPSEIRSVKDLGKLPVTRKDELVRLQNENPPFGGFLAVPLNRLKRIYISPGPIYDAIAGSPEGQNVLAKQLWMAGMRPGDIAIDSMGFHMVPAGLAMVDMLDLLGVTVIPAGAGQSELQVRIIRDLKPTWYLGFPSFLVTLIKRAEEMGYDVRRDFTIRHAFCLGERHLQVLRKSLEEDYNIDTWQNYGTADVGIIAYECEQKSGMHYADEDMIVEVVDPDTGKQLGPGEVGEAVVTLFSQTYPLIRFGTGDLTSFTDEPCPCGWTSPRLTAILGMIGDHVRAKGMFIHLRELDEAMSKFPEISKYQMALSLSGHKDVITLRLEPKEPGVDEEPLSQAVIKSCKEAFRLTVDKIDFLPKGALPEDYKKFEDTRWG